MRFSYRTVFYRTQPATLYAHTGIFRVFFHIFILFRTFFYYTIHRNTIKSDHGLYYEASQTQIHQIQIQLNEHHTSRKKKTASVRIALIYIIDRI